MTVWRGTAQQETKRQEETFWSFCPESTMRSHQYRSIKYGCAECAEYCRFQGELLNYSCRAGTKLSAFLPPVNPQLSDDKILPYFNASSCNFKTRKDHSSTGYKWPGGDQRIHIRSQNIFVAIVRSKCVPVIW